MRFYYISEGEKHGPVPVFALRELVRDGKLNRDSLVWHEGMDKWLPLEKVDAAGMTDEDFGEEKDTPADESLMHDDEAANGPIVMEVGKDAIVKHRTAPIAARVMARWVDITFYQLLIVLVVWPMPMSMLSLLNNEWGMFLIVIIMVGMETIALHLTGTTLGKRLMGIQLVTLHPGRFPLGRALRRSFEVFVFGCGMLVPLLMVFCTIINLWVLRKLGTTLWDHRLGIFPVDIGINAKRWLISFGVIVTIGMSMTFIPEWREVTDFVQKTIEEAQQESTDEL